MASSLEFFPPYSSVVGKAKDLKLWIEQLAIALKNPKPSNKFAEKTDVAEALRRIYWLMFWLIGEGENNFEQLKQYLMSANSKVPYQVGAIILKEDRIGQIPDVLLTYAMYCWRNYQNNDKHAEISGFLSKVIEEISARQSEEPTYHDDKDEGKGKNLVM